MKILITGNMGYVGPGLVKRLRETYPNAELIGFDSGFFANCLTGEDFLPEAKLDKQLFGDVRTFPEAMLDGVEAVVYLAAISNDPMGNKFEEVTMDVNYKACVKMAEVAKSKGVRSFVFASSCSMYGAAGTGDAKKEDDTLNPLTAYARSKVAAEKDLAPLADNNFHITCLRFATACGMSNRIRLDLVLNDFVAGALITKKIDILSDGTPWRPLINVLDMGVAIDWAISRTPDNGGNFLAINTGSNKWNYQVKELAEAVAAIIPGCTSSVNPDAPADKRSYKVNFDLYEKLAPNHQPLFNLTSTIENLVAGFERMGFNDANYRESNLIRLKVLNGLMDKKYLTDKLFWNWK